MKRIGETGKGVEGIGPELVEPSSQAGHSLSTELVDIARSLAVKGNEAGPLENAQMARDGRPADRQPTGDLADGERATAQARHDLLPGRVSERRKGGHMVSLHLRKLRLT